MKKLLTFLVVIALLLVVVLAAVPLFFKDRIVQYVKDTANNNITARLNFRDVDISLLRNFPRATVRLQDLALTNQAPFEGDTLFSATTIDVAFDPLAYLREGVLKIYSLNLDTPRIFLHAIDDNAKNWNITKPSSGAKSSTDTASLRLALKSYSIANGRFHFRKDAAERDFILDNINHTGSGDFANDVFTLVTRTDAAITFAQGGSTYMNKATARLTAEIGMDLKKSIYTFKENELLLNELPLGFEGTFGMPDDRDDYDLDIKFTTRNSDFKSFLSIVPAMYSSKFADLKATGSASLMGFVRGVYNDNTYPAFSVKALVQNGSAEHPKLPAALRGVMLDAEASSAGGSLDNTVLVVQQFSVLFAGNPFDASMRVSTPLSDPNVQAAVKGKINVADLKQLVEHPRLDKIPSGVVAADVKFAGLLSAVKARDYTRFNVSGTMGVENFVYADSSYPSQIGVPAANLDFTTQKATLSNCRIQLGKSDLQANGQLENVVGYALYDSLLTGSLTLASTYFDCNPWMKDSPKDSAKVSAPQPPQPSTNPSPAPRDTSVASIEFPGNINFTMSADMKRVLFSNLDMQEIQGRMTLKDKILRFENLGVKLLGGRMVANGAYNTQTHLQPKTEFSLQLQDFGIQSLYEKFVSVQAFAPFAQYLQGTIGAKIAMRSDLDGHLMPVWESFNSDGGISANTLKLDNFAPFNMLAETLKLDILKNPSLAKLSAFYEIKDGRFYVKPFKTKIANIDVTIEGSNGIDKSIDYTVNLIIPTDKLPTDALGALGNIGGLNLAALKPKTIPVTVKIGGTLEHPIIQPLLSGVQNTVQQVVDAAQEEAKRLAEQEIAKAKEKLKDEADKRVKELEQKAKDEADKKAKELEQKAKDELKKRLPFDIFGTKKDTSKQ
ncbi:MAG: AsmA family protein [Candidatus Kapaibacterium sp.]|nr:MAG: AsmA family protein [Candidatus Kapabacteria bacterium]